MKKLINLLAILTLFISWCSFTWEEKFELDSEFYATWNFREITADEFESLENQNYVLFTFNNFCALAIPCEDIFKDFMDKYKIDFISMKFDEFKNISLHQTVRYAPSVILVHNWKILDFLDSEKDEDLQKFQDVEVFEQRIKQYIIVEK